MPVRTRFVAVALAVIASVGALVVMVSSSASAKSGGREANRSVVVVLRNQDRSLPATRSKLALRRQVVRSQQAPLVTDLSQSGATHLHRYLALNAISATVTPGEQAALQRNPAVAEVVPNGMVHLAPLPASADGNALTTASADSDALTAASGSATPPASGTNAQACPAAGAQPSLEPEALQSMSVDSNNPTAKTARSLGLTGAGVKVAFIADGVDPNNEDFVRPNNTSVFVDYQDFSGDGPGVPTAGGEAFGDASMIAAQGLHVHNIQEFSNFPHNGPCNIRIEGVAPGASLIGLAAFGDAEVAPDTSILQAIDYAVDTDHVNVLNESFGINNYPDDSGTSSSMDLIAQANGAVIADGVTVVESSGDAGPTNTTGEAADDPNVISVGATTDYRLYAQVGYGGAGFPTVKGWTNDNTSSFDSSGFDQQGRTIDAVAPGEDGWAACDPNPNFASCTDLRSEPSAVEQFGGTSMSAPLTSGVAALVIQAYRNTHGGVTPSPALVKQLIVSNTDDIGAPAEQMGTGLVDAYKAVIAAEHVDQPTGTIKNKNLGVLTTSSSQLNAVDPTGASETLTDTVTNDSLVIQHMTFSTRTIGTYQPLVAKTVTLSDDGPTFRDYVPGLIDKFQKVTFTVPKGMGRLSASIAYHGAGAFSGPAKLTLLNPKHQITSYSVPQGVGNFGNVQVSRPSAGKWTALVFSRNAVGDGYSGPVAVAVSAAPYDSFGTVSPASATLAPGQSVPVTEQVSTPDQPGDVAGAIAVHARSNVNSTTSTTIPVTLRSLLPLGDTTFTGTVTGGNGRAPISGQEAFYQFDVPAGQPELNANIGVQDAGNEFGAYLIDPQGQAAAYGTNMIPSAADATTPTDVSGAQLHALNPAAGRWRLVIVFAPVASGDATSSPFTFNVNTNAIPATAASLPDSASTTLKAGEPVTVPVSYTNTGLAPEMVFPDARLDGQISTVVQPLDQASGLSLPLNAELPSFLVPTDSTQLNEGATASLPVQFESQFIGGDPDLASNISTSPTLSLSGDPIATGEWDMLPTEVGPFLAPAPAGTVSLLMTVVTRPFDSTISAPTGDLEADSVNLSDLGSFAPVTVDPGKSVTINVTITPQGTPGTLVSGTLFVDDAAFFEFGSIQDALTNFPQADQVAAIPYEYTIG